MHYCYCGIAIANMAPKLRRLVRYRDLEPKAPPPPSLLTRAMTEATDESLCDYDEMMVTIRARIEAIKDGDSKASKRKFQPKWRDVINQKVKTRNPEYTKIKDALKKLYYTEKLFEDQDEW